MEKGPNMTLKSHPKGSRNKPENTSNKKEAKGTPLKTCLDKGTGSALYFSYFA